MRNINNLDIFDFSLKNREPIIDEFYLKKGKLIISANPKKPTDLMSRNVDLLEGISAYSFSLKNKNKTASKQALERILGIIKSKNINYSEFVSFWSVIDISFSLFNKLPKEQQIEILKRIIEKYIQMRHGLYSTYGYTPTTLQVGKDAKAHKESGSLGAEKVSSILESFGYENYDGENLAKFTSSKSKIYIQTDKKGKKLFRDLIVKNKMKFSWSESKEGKMPDLLFRNGRDIFIVEHKHMKEGGGGQDKQINEIISFIGYKEKNEKIHYISFLDGIYFNLFSMKLSLKTTKISTQIKNIRKNLKLNKQNYFVNTAGFKKLLKVI